MSVVAYGRACTFIALMFGWLAFADSAAAEPAPIKRIAVIAASDPGSYTLKNAAPPLGYPMQFWVNKADSKKKTRILNDRLRSDPQHLGSELTRHLVDALRGRGFEVQILDNVSRSQDEPDEIDYSQIHSDADVILHVWIADVGVYSSPLSTSYLPRVNASARLFKPGHEDFLYEEDLYYGVDAREGKSWGIMPDPKFSFPTFDDLMARIDEVRVSFDMGVKLLAERMSDQISHSISAKSPPPVPNSSAP